MRRTNTKWIAFAVLLLSMFLLITASVEGQQSTNYKVTEFTFNAGGHPDHANIMTSARFQLTLDAIGEGIKSATLTSGSFHVEGGFEQCFPPPGEVIELRFTDQQTLAWYPEKSIGTYNLYRGSIASLPGSAYGNCVQAGLLSETTTDTVTPASGEAYFYLSTAENLLAEEGTKGFASDGSQRANASPCL